MLLVPSALGTHGARVWSGQWTTNTGGVGFRWVPDSEGVAAIKSQGGEPCAGTTDYFRGGYVAGSDRGKVTGCTKGNKRHLIARYVSDKSGRGTFDITYSDGSFSGKYTTDARPPTTGPYTGSFKEHFGGDGAVEKKPKGSCPALRRPSASTSLREAEPECEFTVVFDFGFKKHVLENVSGHGRVTGTSLTKLKPVELASDDDENLIRIKRNGTRIVLDVTSASYRAPKQSGNAWNLILVTTVFRSNDPKCPQGKQVTVHIFEHHGSRKIGTSATACDEYFPRENTENVDRRAKVNVTVKTR